MSETNGAGFLYTHSSYDGDSSWVPHRIIKQTERFVFVERHGWFGREWPDGIECHRVPRADLEREGSAWGGSRRYGATYHTEADRDRRDAEDAATRARLREYAKLHPKPANRPLVTIRGI